MRASELKKHERACVRQVHLSDEKRQRLAAYGVYPGVWLTFRATNLFRDPLLFEADRMLLAIRRKDAWQIEVEA